MMLQKRVGGAFAALAVVVAGVTVVDLDPNVITQLSTGIDGVWVPVDASGEVVRIDTVSGQVTARVPVADEGSRLDVRQPEREGDEVVVVDRDGGNVLAIDPALGRVDRSVSTGLERFDRVDAGSAGVAAATGSSVVHVDEAVASATEMTAPADIASVVVDGEGATTAVSDRVLTLQGDDVEERASDLEAPVVVRAGDRVLWSDGEIVRELDGDRSVCLDSTPSDGAEWTGHASGRVAIADGTQGVLQVLDLDAGSCRALDIADPGTVLGKPGIALGVVFVPEPGRGIVHIVDPDAPRFTVQVPVTLPQSRLQIHTRDDLVVAHDPIRSVGAVLDADGVVATIRTSPPSEGGIQAVVQDAGDAGVSGGGSEAPAIGLETDSGAGGDTTPSSTPLLDADVLSAIVDAPEPDEDDPVSNELQASFAFSTDVAIVGEFVQFIDESTGGPETWVWDFGDGSGGEGPAVETFWAETGTYAVTLKITRGEEKSEVSASITIVDAQTALPPSADFTFSTTVVRVGDPVLFNDTSTGAVARRRWEFGDGTTSEAASPSKTWTSAGNYTVTLTVANDLGSDSASVVIENVVVLDPPVAVIGVDALEFEVGEPVTFRGSSVGGSAALEWFYGDGRAGSGPTVTHVYSEAGNYNVRLLATNDAGADLEQIEITITERTLPPIASIAALPPVVEVGDVLTLNSLSTNNPDTEAWEFGDGAAAEGATVEHTYAAPGVYVVTLRAVNEAGASSTTAMVTVLEELPQPVAAFRAPSTARVGEQLLFVDESTDATSWSWNFGDGFPPVMSPDVLHVFGTTGPKTVTLTVSNRNGESTVTKTVLVLPPEPKADFFFRPAAPDAGSPVSFTDASSNATSWEWDFGDGSPVATTRNAAHTYSLAGSYPVTLTVENSNGDADSMTKTVSVDPPPPEVAALIVDPSTPVAGSEALFRGIAASGSGPITSWSIDFGDGGSFTSADNFFTHTFRAGGSYTVKITASGPTGSDTLTQRVTVTNPAPPKIKLPASGIVPGNPEVGQTVTITPRIEPGSGPIVAWSWKVNGATVPGATGPSLVQTFTTAGTYRVEVTATGPVASDSDSRNVKVVNPPKPIVTSIAANPATGTSGSPTVFTPSLAGGPVLTYQWQVNGVVAGSDPSLNRTFASAGTYAVSVTVTGPGGTDSRSINYSVVDAPVPTTPVASNPAPSAGDPVTFTSGLAPGSGPVSSWAWMVNGSPVAGSGPSLATSFTAAGVYNIAVTAIGPTGVSNSATLTGFAVKPKANFTWTIPTPLTVSFTDLSSPGVTSWTWSFGDTGTSTVSNPIHTYAVAGTYTVTLTVNSPGGSQVVSNLVVVT